MKSEKKKELIYQVFWLLGGLYNFGHFMFFVSKFPLHLPILPWDYRIYFTGIGPGRQIRGWPLRTPTASISLGRCTGSVVWKRGSLASDWDLSFGPVWNDFYWRH